MGLSGTRTLVGFGFGPIQSGLFLYEAFQSGNFKRLVIDEIAPDVVKTIREADGFFNINIASNDRIDQVRIGPIEIYNPTSGIDDKNHLKEAIAEADELVTAVPSVTFYRSESEGSLQRVLAEGLIRKVEQGGPAAVIYTAENNNHAAEILGDDVMSCVPNHLQESIKEKVQFLNTVIGKMSHVVIDLAEIQAGGLRTITPNYQRAFLVESFNRILISRITLKSPFQRGIQVFEEKDNLLQFEEAKLYGHNASHALLGYIGALRSANLVHQVQEFAGVIPFVRDAFIRESGKPLISKYQGNDILFTEEGFREFAEDLIARMINPYLADSIDHVIRDPIRKLGWHDRLIGTMRLALTFGIPPVRYALGAAAALAALDAEYIDSTRSSRVILKEAWDEESGGVHDQESIISMIDQARDKLKVWRDSGYPDLQRFFQDYTS